MTLARSVADVLADHVTLEVECIDRMYLNLYVPKLQYTTGVVGFFKHHRQMPFASSALMDPMTRGFVRDIERFVAAQGLDLVTFERDERKDDESMAILDLIGHPRSDYRKLLDGNFAAAIDATTLKAEQARLGAEVLGRGTPRRRFNQAVFTSIEVRDGKIAAVGYQPPFELLLSSSEFEYGDLVVVPPQTNRYHRQSFVRQWIQLDGPNR